MARGRPTKLTPDIQNQLCQAIRTGAYIETAAAFVNISKTSLYKWMKRGRKAKSGLYRGFVNAIEKAMADAEMRDLMVIDKAAAGVEVTKSRTTRKLNAQGQVIEETTYTEKELRVHWQAAAWKLERRNPRRWGRQPAEEDDEQQTKPPVVIGFDDKPKHSDDPGGDS